MSDDDLQPDIVALINEYIGDIEQTPDYQRQQYLRTALEVLLTPEQFTRLIRRENSTALTRQDYQSDKAWRERMATAHPAADTTRDGERADE